MIGNIGRKISWSAFCLTLAIAGSTIAVESADSTLVREPQPRRKSLGDVLLAVPSTLITIPAYALKGIAWGVVTLTTQDTFVGDIVKYFSRPQATVAPLVSYEANEGLAGGVAVRRWNTFGNGDRTRLKLLYSWHDYSTADLKYTHFGAADNALRIGFNASYDRMPRETYYGPGNDAAEHDEVAFTMERTRVRGNLSLYPSRGWTIGAFAGYSDYNIFDGRDPDRLGDLAAIRERFSLSSADIRSAQFITIGGGLESDNRNSGGQPSRGGRRSLEVSYHTGVGSDDNIEFVQTRFEASQYIDLFEKRILAIRVIAQDIDRSRSASPNPFYLLSSLGGAESLRGYRTNRLVDRDMALVTIEYRYPIWDVIDAFLFLDEGRVFHSISDELSLRGWKYSAGFGLRVWNPDEVVVSAQFAKSDDGVQFFFHAGQDF